MLRCKAGILDDATHRERVHGVVPWDGQDSPAVGHDDVLALPGNVESSLFERPYGPKVRDPGHLRHALRRDFHFPQILLTGQLFGYFEVFANCVLNVRQSFFFRGALRPAPGEARARDAVSLLGWHQSNWVLHTSNSNTPFTAPTP